MAWITRQIPRCDACGHEWLTNGQPKQCAKCKSWKWNANGGGLLPAEPKDKLPDPRKPARPRVARRDSAGRDEVADSGKGSRAKVCVCGMTMSDWGRVWKCRMCRAEVKKGSNAN